jgi:hypothetical protein
MKHNRANVHTYVRDFECQSIYAASERTATHGRDACTSIQRDPSFLWPASDDPANMRGASELASCLTCYSTRRIIGSRRAAAPRPGASVLRVLPHRDFPTLTRRRPAQHLTRSSGVRGEVQWWTYNVRILRASNTPRAAVPETPKRAG